MPLWVTTPFLEYAKRFPKEFPISLIEIPLKKSNEILNYFTPKSLNIALDERGMLRNSQEFAKQMGIFQLQNREVNFFIGGPDGHSKELLSKADLRWSLSPLTLPHPLVRVVLIEQLYRAISILNHHPYHRE